MKIIVLPGGKNAARMIMLVNILGKIGFGALGGFDTVAIFAGECRGKDAAASIRRSVWIATPLIAGAFILGTACVLVFVKPDGIERRMNPLTEPGPPAAD
jgi:hypothetical protein